MSSILDRRPIIIVLAGPNGAGKTTFYYAHLQMVGLRFVNADELGREMGLSPYEAAEIAGVIRKELVRQKESFVMETVFSDPCGDKINFLKYAIEQGYTVVICYIGVDDSSVSEERIAMRVSQGGHDAPTDKVEARFPRSLANLKRAIQCLPFILVFDNSDLRHPFRKVAEFRNGRCENPASRLPKWLHCVCCDVV